MTKALSRPPGASLAETRQLRGVSGVERAVSSRPQAEARPLGRVEVGADFSVPYSGGAVDPGGGDQAATSGEFQAGRFAV